MAIKRSPCGGFAYDGDSLFFTNKNGIATLVAIPTIIKVSDYLYEVEYNTYDYQDGYDYYKQYHQSPSCSAVRKGNIIGRNLDWNYTNGVDFVVKTKATNGKYATIGVAHTNINQDDILDGRVNDKLLILPFITNDCLNQHGVYANMNVVYAGDKGVTSGTHKGKKDICQLMLPRYICDYAKTAKEALDLIDDVNVFAPLSKMNNECHLMVCDENDTYIVEFINNQMKVFSSTDDEYDDIPNDKNIITNFYLSCWNGDIKSVALGDTIEETKATGLNTHAMGLERYNILSEHYDDIATANDMAEAMESVKFTLAYSEDTTPFWYSEFVDGGLTIYSPQDDFAEIKQKSIEHYNKHIRDGLTWQTCHTSIYDIDNKQLSVYVDEDYTEKYDFKLNIAGKL